MAVHKASPGVAGLLGDQLLHSVAAVSAHQQAVVEGGISADASDDKIAHRPFVAGAAADGAVGQAVVEVDLIVLELVQSIFGFFGELFEHLGAAVVAERIFHDALPVFVGLRDLEAAWEIGKALTAGGAILKRAILILRV